MSVQYSGTGVTFADGSSQTTAPTGYGFKNRIINGAMMIDQRNAGASVTISASDTYGSVDRFCSSVFGSGTGRFTIQQSSTAPSGFINSALITVTTADASPSAAYGYSVRQLIEGLNCADLGWGAVGASTVTLSFWVRSSVTGTFSAIVYNSAADRVYGATYTISSANTFEYKTITIAGDTSGTWLKTNGIGMQVTFGLGGGANRTFSTGWQAGTGTNPSFVTGATNLMATNGATFYITGVQLEKGSTATSFDYRPYGTELALCQRYYTQFGTTAAYEHYAVGVVQSGNVSTVVMGLPVTMRAAPTFSYAGSLSNYVIFDGVAGAAPTAIATDTMAPNICSLAITGTSLTAGRGARFYRSANLLATISYSAEL